MSSDRQELESFLIVNFPRSIDKKAFLDVLGFVGGSQGCEFSYQAEVIGSVGAIDAATREPIPKEEYIKSLRGTVRTLSTHRSANFGARLDNNYDGSDGTITGFRGIRFEVTPGYNSIAELQGRGSDDVDTMRAVRAGIEAYFAK